MAVALIVAGAAAAISSVASLWGMIRKKKSAKKITLTIDGRQVEFDANAEGLEQLKAILEREQYQAGERRQAATT